MICPVCGNYTNEHTFQTVIETDRIKNGYHGGKDVYSIKNKTILYQCIHHGLPLDDLERDGCYTTFDANGKIYRYRGKIQLRMAHS